MVPLAVLLSLGLIGLGFLVLERVALDRHRRAVPLRIAVTGTRGKTSVTRLLAAVLRENGQTVLAKSTGSEAAYVLPDGTEERIRRRGCPSIVEQKRLLQLAARLGADTVVAEIMSLHPENHRVEVREIIRPHMVLVTNFRVDHVEAQGATPAEVASVLALDVPPGATALVPESEWRPDFAAMVESGGGVTQRVPSGAGNASGAFGNFGGNLDLVHAAARSLGIEDDVVRAGIRRARGDLGALGIWRYRRSCGAGPWLVVNAFAANDPLSTLHVYDRVLQVYGLDAGDCIGLLSLRPDRGDRTLQWVESLRAGSIRRFRRLYVTGLHARALQHRIRHIQGAERVTVLAAGAPRMLMDRILDADREKSGFLFGFGNIGGLGERLVRHWREVGEYHGI